MNQVDALKTQMVERISDVPADQWNRLAGDNPLISHDFLAAMEQHGAVSEYSGWQPVHLTMHRAEQLVAAVPLYIKSHSYGEFVFDWAWADAYQQQGLDYYPKLLCASPLTPATGPRILCQDPDLRKVIPELLVKLCQEHQLSSIHVNFVEPGDAATLRDAGFLERTDWQYHWQNRGYQSFDDFLGEMTSKKRKNIRQERNRLGREGWTFERVNGADAGEWHWLFMHGLYRNTFEKKGNWALLTQSIFRDWGRSLGSRITLVLARRGDKYRAGSFLIQSDSTMFGRYWGTFEDATGLHFETCYYQGLEHAIESGLSTFDPGAQGTHKIARGFEPVMTRSFHWLDDETMRTAVANSLERERIVQKMRGRELDQRKPFKQAT